MVGVGREGGLYVDTGGGAGDNWRRQVIRRILVASEGKEYGSGVAEGRKGGKSPRAICSCEGKKE